MRRWPALRIAARPQADRDHSGHHLYVLRVNFKEIGKTRSQVMGELLPREIATQVHYIPVPAHPFYRLLGHRIELYPNALKYYEEALTIPLFFDLTDEQQAHIISALKKVVS